MNAGPLGWLAAIVAMFPTIAVALWNRSGSGPRPLVSAAICGAFLSIATVMLIVDKGAGEIIFRNPLALLMVMGVWLLGTLTIYVSLHSQWRGHS